MSIKGWTSICVLQIDLLHIPQLILKIDVLYKIFPLCTMGKMVPDLARRIERTIHWSLIFSYFVDIRISL